MAGSSQLDLFGRRHWRPSPVAPRTQGDLFDYPAWLDAARAWAEARGLAVDGWTIARRVRVGGEPFAVEWDPDAGEGLDRGVWVVWPVTDAGPGPG